MLYQVVNWETSFEGAKSKRYKNKTTCQMPTKHGLGYRRLVKNKNGAAIFGAWCAMIQVLSRHACPRQGYLTDTGGPSGIPLVPDDLELLTDIPASVFESMLQVCLSDGVGWIKDTTRIPQGYHEDTAGPLDSDSDSDLDLDSKASSGNRSKPPMRNIPECLASMQGFIDEWTEYLKSRKTKATPRAQELLLKRLSERPGQAVMALQTAIVRGWTGIEWEWIDRQAKPNNSPFSPLPAMEGYQLPEGF